MEIKHKIANLLSVKSIITVAMTIVMCVLLLGDYSPSKELLSLYCTTYGAVIAYYFMRKEHNEDEREERESDCQ